MLKKEVKKVELSALGIEKGSPAESVEGVADAETRKAGEVIEDDGNAAERILAFLVQVKAV